ncbi:uncharacterized protein [Montipora foliosa]|uniref:uncharacterized protein n=1 Tax=Montipora foliosa TaxID=591990 RepID=UPI0035F1C03A
MAGRPPFDQFNSEDEEIDSYLERLQEYVIAYDIKDGTEHAAKRRAILLTSIGSVLKDLSFPHAPNTKTFEQLAALLRDHYKPTRLKVAERYRFHAANQRPGESITDYVRELKKLDGTCEFTNDQLQDSLGDSFICGLRSEQIKRKLLSANYTFQEAVDAAIDQETAQNDVQALGSNSLGVRSPAGVNKVKRYNLSSRNRTSTTGRHNARNDKQMQPTGATQRCFRCGLTNHSPDNCKYTDFECHRCHQKGHLRSECRNTKPPRPKAERRQHVRLADQDAEEKAPVGGEDQFFEFIFNMDGAQSSVSQNLGMATPAVKVPVLIEDTEFLMEVDTGAAASILSYSDYERHFKY